MFITYSVIFILLVIAVVVYCMGKDLQNIQYLEDSKDGSDLICGPKELYKL